MTTSYPKKINLNYIDQVSYLQGMHRSGWPYVVANLLTLQNDQGVLCDTYVDRTFLWAGTSDIVPYKVPWIGFVHHTFDTTFSVYNNVTLLQNENFVTSLPECKGLFVFSSLARENWRRILTKMGYDVPVVSLIHPTQFVSTRFTMRKFKENDDRKLIQIGAWLRDNYAIYRLNDGNPTFRLENGTFVHKAALIGPKMEHYYRPFDFFRQFRPKEWKQPEIIPPALYSGPRFHAEEAAVQETISSINGELPQDIVSETQGGIDDGMCRDICRDIMCRDSDFGLNKYVKGAIDLLSELDASVITYPMMSDDEYDVLLSENIVFLKLIDAAAVNTLQECIVRNTPIVVNPLPAVVEMLGENYPLYFEDLDEVPDLITLEKISAAHDYLVEIPKDSLSISYFMESFVNSVIYKNF